MKLSGARRRVSRADPSKPNRSPEPDGTERSWRYVAGRAICVIGNLNIDLIVRNVPDLPAWGQEVAGTDNVAASSGQAGYLAMALARLGVPDPYLTRPQEA